MFVGDCDPVKIGNRSLNCLLYADDVVLFSRSKEGLQNCLNKIENYCNQWCLQINITKTKIVIFNKSGKIIKQSFTLNGEILENVQAYKYLGIIFTASGSFSHARKDLYQRALKAVFKLNSIFGDVTPQVKTSFHVFDHLIKPILMYGEP